MACGECCCLFVYFSISCFVVIVAFLIKTYCAMIDVRLHYKIFHEYHKNCLPHNAQKRVPRFSRGPVCSAIAAVVTAYLGDLIYLKD